ncbi:hypothetical protein LARI1_G000651 [Lachnellula arida]|uniref:Uncharacterized protein n=1 Tax=Lachnellula arida TaxID=1316785 RepID=A0A8T9BM83_9HELO|nr:hypothetical protein LARI1_G000651 [Lachnellula arida]
MASARNAPLSSTEILGTRLLAEIESEEGSLEDLLKDLRTSTCTTPTPNQPRTGIPDLDTLWHSHGSRQISITGRALPLIYHLITHLVQVSSPEPNSNSNSKNKNKNNSLTAQGTVAILDLERRFSPSHLLRSLSPDHLKHIYVWHPTPATLAATLASVEQFMVYGAHASRERVWRGVFVLGGNVAGAGNGVRGGGDVVTVTTGWRGWVRVEREAVEGCE